MGEAHGSGLSGPRVVLCSIKEFTVKRNFLEGLFHRCTSLVTRAVRQNRTSSRSDTVFSIVLSVRASSLFDRYLNFFIYLSLF